ncbi:endonuclease NucS domain-containing protein [Pseudomonadota bacterium]
MGHRLQSVAERPIGDKNTVLEKDIENLLAMYPEEFFPRAGFKLIGQQVKLGPLRADILFEDKYQRTIIIEVKRGILTRDAAGQILDYYHHVKQAKPDEFVELVLCANIIPHQRRSFLEASGIDCKEVSPALVSSVAAKYKYQFTDEARNTEEISEKQELTTSEVVGRRAWIFQANPTRFDILNALTDPKITSGFHWHVQRYRHEIKPGDTALIWMSGKGGGIYGVAQVASEPNMLFEPSYESNYWIDEEERDVEKLRVKLKLVHDLSNRPLRRERLKEVTELQNLSILKFAQGTNFKVTDEEWRILERMLPRLSSTETDKVI